MAIRTTSPNSRGVLKLELFPATSVPTIHGEPILQKFDEPAIVAAVNSLVDEVSPILWLPPLPSGDDGANISAAIAANKYVKLFPGDVYNLITGVQLPPEVSSGAFDASGAVLSGNMPHSGGSANSLIFSQRVLDPAPATTIADAPGVPQGQNIVNLASGAGAGPGVELEIASAAGAGAVKTYFKVQARNVNQITLDAPVLLPFVTGDPVRVVSGRLRNFTIIVEGTVFTGGGDRAISLSGADKVDIVGKFTVDTTFTNDAGAALTGGVELVACTECSIEEGYVNGWLPAANADVFDIGFRFASCVGCTAGTLRAAECTVANVLVFDCAQCVFQTTRVYDSLTALASGIAVGGTAAANPGGCIECDFYTVDVDNIFNGFGMDIDRATRCNVYSYHGQNGGGFLQFGFAHAEDLYFGDVTIVGSAAVAATGFGQGVVVGSGGFNKGSYIDSLTQIDCGSTVGTDTSTADIESSIVIGHYVQRNPNVATTRGVSFALFDVGDVVRVKSAEIETCPTGTVTQGAINLVGELATGAKQRTFIEDTTITLLGANDVGISHTSSGITSVAILTDVEVLNPNSVGGTSGYVGTAGTVLRRYGRCDFHETATPVTANESNIGTFVTNQNVAVTVNFADITQQQQPFVTILIAAGTPSASQAISVSTDANFTFTGALADTSLRVFDIP